MSLKTALSIKNKRHNDVFYWSRPQKLRSLPFDQNGEKTPPRSCLHPRFRGLSVWWERPPAHGLAVRLEPHDNFRGHRDLMKRWREVGDATVKVTRPRWPRPPPRRGAEPRTGGVWCPGSPAVLEGGLAGDRPGACRMRPPRRRTRTRTGRPRPARGRTPVRARRPARGRSRDAHDVQGHVRAAGRMERGASQGTALRAAWRARCPLPRRCGRSRQARGDAHMALKCLVSVRTNGRLCLFLMKIHKRQKG